MAYFFEMPFMASLKNLCSDAHKFLKEITFKKLGKKNVEQFFLAHQKFSKIFHGPSTFAKNIS